MAWTSKTTNTARITALFDNTTAITILQPSLQVNLCELALQAENWRILLEQSYTAYMATLMATMD